MRILQVLSDAQLGGGPRFVALLTEGLVERGHQVSIMAPSGPAAESLAAAGAPVYPWRDLGRLAAWADVINTHGKRAGLYRFRATKPVVHHHHGLHFRGVKGRAELALERYLGRKFTALTVHVASHQGEEGRRLKLNGLVIPLGIPGQALADQAYKKEVARSVLKLPQDGFLIGAVGRLDPVKRWDLVVRALRPTRNVTLVLVGDGADRDRLFRIAKTHQVADRVICCGEVPYAWRYLRAFDVLVNPSKAEGCPLIVLEAVALGVPILLSNIPAHRELVGGAGMIGAFYGEDELAGWHSALAHAVSSSLPLVAPLQRASLDPAYLSTKLMVDSHESVYAYCCSQPVSAV